MYIRSIKHLHLEITNRCNAACPSCPRTGPNTKKQLADHMVTAGWKDLSLEDIKEIHKHTPYITRVNLCGNFGDPAAAPDFFKIVEYFVDNKIRVIISTNGGLRTPFLWASIAGPLVLAQFHIDGDEDTNHMYRVGTRFDKIMANAKGFIDAGGQANWTFIPFAHNEHVIDKCEKMLMEMGFRQFKVKKTYRVGNNDSTSHRIELPLIRNTLMNTCTRTLTEILSVKQKMKMKFIFLQTEMLHHVVGQVQICGKRNTKILYLQSLHL